MNDASVLTVSGVGKTYVEPVLADVTLDLVPGEALALTGENGAGKSTLSKIIGGLVNPTAGTMTLAGKPYTPQSRTEAEALGVRMVMQELNLLSTLSIAENLFLNRLPKKGGFGWIDRKKLVEDARHAMAQVGLDAIDPDTLVGALGIGHQQMVEIARNLIGDCRVLILDEPTAMLTAREVDLLFEQIDRLKARGVALVYISHRLEELRRVAERAAVLRDGRLVHLGPMAELSSDRLVTLMVGRELGERIDLGEKNRRRGAEGRRHDARQRGARRLLRSEGGRDFWGERADRRGPHRTYAPDLRRGSRGFRHGLDCARRAGVAARCREFAIGCGEARHRAHHGGPQGRGPAAWLAYRRERFTG